MRPESANPDSLIARIAGRQHGVVTFAQLVAAGLSGPAIARRVRKGLLHRVHKGVYAVGHVALSHRGRCMAAVLACGEGAVLSHISAAQLWGLLPTRSGPIHVTTPTAAGRRKRKNLHIHRSPSLANTATTRLDGIAVTTVARTLADLKRTAAQHVYRRALRQAEYRGLDLGDIATDGTRSELESAFRAICRRYRIPEPEVNAKIGPYTVDFYWPDHGLVVETDGYDAHRGRQAFVDDRARDLYLRSRGLRCLRFSDDQIDNEQAAVAADVKRSLSHQPPP